MRLIEWSGFSFLFPSTTLLKRKISILLLIFLLLAGGGYFAVKVFKIEIKARLAQVLLQHAWEKTLVTGDYHRPWPSFDGNPILLLHIPKHHVNQVVLRGTTGQALAFGPAFHEESFLPFEKGTVAISSHRDTHGTFIRHLIKGDLIKMQDQHNDWHSYTVDDLFIVDVNKNNIALSQYDDRLLIITCYPFDALRSGTPLRYVVSARKFQS